VPFVSTGMMMSHPREVLTVMCSGLVAAGLGGGVFLAIFGVKRSRFERGMRRLELFLLSAGGFATAAAAFVALLFVPSMSVPAWLPGALTALVQVTTLLAKAMFFCWLFVWVRWTLPRFRYDQLMGLGWKLLLPAAIANVLITGLLRIR